MTFSDDIPDEWRGVLRPGERIVWQGAPGADNPYEHRTSSQKFFDYVFLIGVPAVIFLWGGSDPKHSKAIVILSGLVATGLLSWQAFGRTMLASYKVRHSFYTLTSQRAFTGWQMFGRRCLDNWDIDRHMKIELERLHLGSVYFAEEIHKSDDSNWTEKIGFLNIPDASEVYDLMLKVQKGRA